MFIDARRISIAVIATALSGSINAQGLDADAIMEKNYYASKIRSLRSESTMTLTNDKGQTRVRKSTSVGQLQSNGTDTNLLVKFLEPADIRGVGFMQLEHSDGDDDLWIYLPALKKSRRLVANNKRESFVGSDFSYGDILLPKPDTYFHTLLADGSPTSECDCYVVESVPKSEATRLNSGYNRKVSLIRKDSFLEKRIDYFDLSGRLLKTQTIAEHMLVEPDTNRWFARQRTMINHQTNHKTEFHFDHIEPGVGLPSGFFTTRQIERE